MANKDSKAQEQTTQVLLRKLELERKKSSEVTDTEIELVNKLVWTTGFNEKSVNIVWPSLCRNPSQKQIRTLMKDGQRSSSQNAIYSGIDSFWVGTYHNLENTPEEIDLGKKIIRAAAEIVTDSANAASDYSLINFYNRISSPPYSSDCFNTVSDGIVHNPQMISVMIEELNKEMIKKQSKDSVTNDDIYTTREFLMRTISVSELPEGQIACTNLMNTLHNAERKRLEKKQYCNFDNQNEEQKQQEWQELDERHAGDKKILDKFSTNSSSPHDRELSY